MIICFGRVNRSQEIKRIIRHVHCEEVKLSIVKCVYGIFFFINPLKIDFPSDSIYHLIWGPTMDPTGAPTRCAMNQPPHSPTRSRSLNLSIYLKLKYNLLVGTLHVTSRQSALSFTFYTLGRPDAQHPFIAIRGRSLGCFSKTFSPIVVIVGGCI